jgi:AraC-like DNA-binding protein
VVLCILVSFPRAWPVPADVEPWSDPARVYDRGVAHGDDRASETHAVPSGRGGLLAPQSGPLAPESGGVGPGIDALSDVLRTVRLTGALFFRVEARAPWGLELPDGATLAPSVLPRAQHVISYHVVTDGACWGTVRGETPVRLEAGDVLVLPRGDAYAMSMTPAIPAGPDRPAVLAFMRQMAAGQLPFTISEGGRGPARLHLVCGFLGCDLRPFNPLLATLPRLLHVRRAAGPGGDPLGQLIDFTVAEARERRVGGECVRLRLSELIFVEVVRRYLASLPAGETGWLAALRDPVVGTALARLHGEPARAWTLETLARDVGRSRSVLADRFTHLVGHAPMQYLTGWRMQVAARLLAEDAMKVSAVAREVGYDSEAAFSRAFKRIAGVPPGAWRSGRA